MYTMYFLAVFCLFSLLAAAPVPVTDIQRVLDHINMYRARHQAPPVTVDSTISSFSQSWSDNLAANRVFEHSRTKVYGENLARLSFPMNGTIAVIRALDMWYSEVKDYDFLNSGFDFNAGHFTQLVWLATRKIGMGVSFASGWGTVICM